MSSYSLDYRKFTLAQITIDYFNILKNQKKVNIDELFGDISETSVELSFFKKGIDFILKGYSMERIQFSMELDKMVYIKSPCVDEEDLLLIFICEKLIPCIKDFDLSKTDTIFSYLFSEEQYKELQKSLKKIDIKYNLTKNDIIYNIYSLLNSNYFYPNTTEDIIEELKLDLGISDYTFTKNYVYDRCTFSYIAQSDIEEILIDLYNPGDCTDIDKLRNKINYIKEEIFLNEDNLSLVIGVLYNSDDGNTDVSPNSSSTTNFSVNNIVISKTINNIEKLLYIVKSCSSLDTADINSLLLMIINKNGISFLKSIE